MLTISVKKPLNLNYRAPSVASVRELGALAQQVMLQRVAGIRNANDQAAKPYSPRGPIYVPNTGVQGRTKSALGGRQVLSSKDRTRIRKAGRGGAMGKTRGGKTTKFANYSAYKAALGKSGQRDLELSGKMLGSVGIVRANARSVVVGFLRESEHQKALGNQKRDPWFGLSPADSAKVVRQAEQILRPRIAAD